MSVVQGRGDATRKNFPLIHKRFLDFGNSDAEAFMPAGEGVVVEVVAVMGCHADREEKESDEGKHRESVAFFEIALGVYTDGDCETFKET